MLLTVQLNNIYSKKILPSIGVLPIAGPLNDVAEKDEEEEGMLQYSNPTTAHSQEGHCECNKEIHIA